MRALLAALLLAAAAAPDRLPMPWAGLELVRHPDGVVRAAVVTPGGAAATAGVPVGAELRGRIGRDGLRSSFEGLDVRGLAASLTCVPGVGISLLFRVDGADRPFTLACEPADPPPGYWPGKPPPGATPERLAKHAAAEARRLEQARKLARRMPLVVILPIDELTLEPEWIELEPGADGVIAPLRGGLDGDRLFTTVSVSGRCHEATVKELRVSGGQLPEPLLVQPAPGDSYAHGVLKVPAGRLGDALAGCTPARSTLELLPLEARLRCSSGHQLVRKATPRLARTCAAVPPGGEARGSFVGDPPWASPPAIPAGQESLVQIRLPQPFEVGALGPVEVVELSRTGKVLRTVGRSVPYGHAYVRVRPGTGGIILAVRLRHPDGKLEYSAPITIGVGPSGPDAEQSGRILPEQERRDFARARAQADVVEHGCPTPERLAGWAKRQPKVRSASFVGSSLIDLDTGGDVRGRVVCPPGPTATERRKSLAATAVKRVRAGPDSEEAGDVLGR